MEEAQRQAPDLRPQADASPRSDLGTAVVLSSLAAEAHADFMRERAASRQARRFAAAEEARVSEQRASVGYAAVVDRLLGDTEDEARTSDTAQAAVYFRKRAAESEKRFLALESAVLRLYKNGMGISDASFADHVIGKTTDEMLTLLGGRISRLVQVVAANERTIGTMTDEVWAERGKLRALAQWCSTELRALEDSEDVLHADVERLRVAAYLSNARHACDPMPGASASALPPSPPPHGTPRTVRNADDDRIAVAFNSGAMVVVDEPALEAARAQVNVLESEKNRLEKAMEGMQQLVEEQSAALRRAQSAASESQDTIDGLMERLTETRTKANANENESAEKRKALSTAKKELQRELESVHAAHATALADEKRRTAKARADLEEERLAHRALRADAKWAAWVAAGGGETKPARHYLTRETFDDWRSMAKLGAIPDKSTPCPPNTPWPFYVPENTPLKPFALWL